VVSLPVFDCAVFFSERSSFPNPVGFQTTVTTPDVKTDDQDVPAEKLVKAPWVCVRDWKKYNDYFSKNPEADRNFVPESCLVNSTGAIRPFVDVFDPFLNRQNPVENMAQVMEQSKKQFLRSPTTSKQASRVVSPTRASANIRAPSGRVAPGPKPTALEWSKLHGIIHSSSRFPSKEARDLLLKFKLSLLDQKSALVKILFVLNWENQAEVDIIRGLLPQWSPLAPADALALLGYEFKNRDWVRTYAVDRLRDSATDEEIELYLLQLVQALRYDNGPEGPLTLFLCERASRGLRLATAFFWHLQSEATADPGDQLFLGVGEYFWKCLLSSQNLTIKQSLERQCEFRCRLLDINKQVSTCTTGDRNAR
jgi:hypothetical protein